MKTILRALPLALLMITMTASAAVYKYVDKNGEVHYTDKPVPGARRLDLPQIQTYSPGELPPPSTVPEPGQGKAQAVYESVSLVRPQPKETFRSAERTVILSVRTQPALRLQDRFMFYLDGKPVLAEPTRSNTTVIKVMARGTHHASAAVIGPEGKSLARSAPVEFYMKPPVVGALNNAASRP